LQQSTRFYGKGVPEFLRTHPMSENRVADTRGRAEVYPYRQYPDTLGYALTKAKIAVLTEPDKRVVTQHFTALEQQGTTEQRAVARYGLGLIQLETLQFDAAAAIFQQLADQYPQQSQYLSALARTYSESRNYEKANTLFAKAVNNFPNNDAIKLEYTRSLLKSNQAAQAKQMLQSLSENQKNQQLYFELLAQIFAELKQPGESHRYTAEYYYATGQTEEAIMQIRLGKQENDLSYQLQAILNERLNFFLMEEADRKLERR